MERLKSSLRKFYGQHGDLIQQYEVSLNDLLTLDKLQLHPKQPEFLLISWPGTWFRPLFGTCLCSNFWDQISRICRVFTRLFTLNTPRLFSQFCLIPSLTFTELQVVSMERLQRLWQASRERFPFRTPGSVLLLGTCLCSNCWDQFPELAVSFLDFSLRIPLGTFSILFWI